MKNLKKKVKEFLSREKILEQKKILFSRAQSEIEDLRCEHHRKTQEDLGISDGEIDFETMVKFLGALVNDKTVDWEKT
jgi:hypothetical protein